MNKQARECTLDSMNEPAQERRRPSHPVVDAVSCHSLVKAVTVLYEVVQLLSGVFNHVLVELHAMVHAKGTCAGKRQNELLSTPVL